MSYLYIVWDVSPIIFHIGSIGIRWYGVLFALSFAVGYFIMQRIFRYENLPESLLDKLSIYMLAGTVLGARLGHTLFYEPHYYLKHPLDILKVWEGGLASHGAAIGILLALFLFIRRTNVTYLWVLDRIVIVVALAGFFIRLGNLFNSEIYGKPTSAPWGFIFIRAGENIPRHPTQIYEGFCYLIIFIILLMFYFKKNEKPREGFLFSFFLIVLFGIRFLLEFLKEPQVQFENSLVLNMGQLLSIPFMLLGIVILLYRPKTSKRSS